MGLTGLDIYKQLPKKNCAECGPPTCLAFAMALASGKAALDACPYVSDAAKEALGAASAPPIRMVKIGTAPHELVVGDETVIFRHDKTFFHETGVAVQVTDDLDDSALDAKMARINDLKYERVGLKYTVNLVAVKHVKGSPEDFAAFAKKVADRTPLALVLMADCPNCMDQAAGAVAARRPLLYAATVENFDNMLGLAKKYNLPLTVHGKDLDETASLAEKASSAGVKDLVLDAGQRKTADTLYCLTQCRRLAIKRKFRPLGFPTIAFTTEENSLAEVVQASVYIAKYASIVVIKTDVKEHVLPLLTLRQNIYTDPQKPIQVEAKWNAVGAATPDSPVYVTTNFSLTYYTVEGEVAASKIPSYILAVGTDGTSVLTAWAAGKFTSDSIAAAIKASGIEDRVSHRNVVIPGFVAVLSGKLGELSGWKVLVGPREAAGIPAYAKQRFGAAS